MSGNIVLKMDRKNILINPGKYFFEKNILLEFHIKS